MSSSEQKLDRLEKNVTELVARRDDLRTKANKKKEERNRLNEEVQNLRKLAVSEKEERDNINSQVAKLKTEVHMLQIKLEDKTVSLDKETEEKNEARRKLPSKHRLIQELQQIEWTLSTTPTLEIKNREAKLVERAEEIRTTLKEHNKVQAEFDKLMHTLADQRAIELHIRNRRNEMQILHTKSQEHHERMLQFYSKVDEEKKKADEAHSAFVKILEAIKDVNSEMDKVMPKIKSLRQELRIATNFRVTKREKELVSKRRELTEIARKKLQSGEKLTIEEMKLIYGE